MSLHVAISGWLLDGHSGANRRLWTLLTALPPLLAPAERITVLHAPGLTPPPLPGLHFVPLAIPPRPTWRRVLAERTVLPRWLREHRVDVLDHAFLPVPAVSCPVVLTIHDVRDADGFGRRPRWLGRRALRTAVRRAHSIVTPSEFTAARIRAFARAEPVIHVVRNALAPMPAPATERPPESPFLLHVGHLEPRKNVELLIRALACMPPEARPKLRLAGADAGSGEALQRLARTLGVSGSLEFAGVVDDATLAAWYATAAAVCVPSRYEGFGLPAVEAIAAGAPTLVADAGALPEVVGSAGVVLPVDDPDAWARAWSPLLTRPRSPSAPAAETSTTTAPAMAAALLTVWRAAGPV
ncbi:MAG: glycosyltransferase [Planctomycetes bacterium]|nr:glycosyltransferase [Planctomycetota bacterium]